MADLLIRTGKGGDLFGLRRSGWSWKKYAAKAPRGVVFHEEQPIGSVKSVIKTRDRKIAMADQRFLAELDRMEDGAAESAEFPLRMIGLREMNSHNSWMHNSPRLMPDKRRHHLHINPDDAAALGLAEDDLANLASEGGAIEVQVTLNPEMIRGTVALPHGWGHAGGWQRANAAGGSTSNFLSSRVEKLSGTSVLNGIPVRLEAVATSADVVAAAESMTAQTPLATN
jgi:formate dehydrogenase